MSIQRIGLKLKGNKQLKLSADVKEFWENENNPHVTKEQIEMFKEAKRIYKEHPF